MTRARNVNKMLIASLSQPIIGFFITVFVARFLTASEFGYYSLLLAIISSFVILFSFGVEKSMLYFLPKEKEKSVIRDAILLTLLQLVIFVPVIILSWSFIQSVYSLDPDSLYIVVAGVFLGMFCSLFFYVLQATKRFSGLMWSNILFKSGKMSSVVFVLIGAGYLGAVAGDVLGTFVGLLISLVFLRGMFTSKGKSTINKILRYSGQLYVGTLSYFFINLFVNWYAGLMNIDWVAYISVSVRVSSLMMIPAAAIVGVFIPEFSEGKEKLFKLASKWVIITSILLCSIVLPNVEFILTFVFSQKYLAATSTMFFYTIAFSLMALTHVISGLFIGTNKPHMNAIFGIISAAVAIITLMVFMPVYGSSGAGISLIFVYLTGFIFMVIWMVRNKINYPYKTLGICLVAGILSYSIGFIFGGFYPFYKFLLSVFSGLLVYTLILFLSREISLDEIRKIIVEVTTS